MQNKIQKRVLAAFLSVSLMFSTVFVSSAEGACTDINTTDAGDSRATTDGSDVGTMDADIFSQSAQTMESCFRVTDSSGAEFGVYADWSALLAAFKTQGNPAEKYTVTVSGNAVIGTTMPSKAGALHLEPADEGGILLFGGSTVNMTCALSIGEVGLCVAGSEGNGGLGTTDGADSGFTGIQVNINTKGKALTLDGTRNVGNLRGTASGSLDIVGDVEVKGTLQTFKYVTVNGNLRLNHNMTAITNLDIGNGKIYLAPGRNFTVTNVIGVTEGQNGTLIYPGEGAMPNVKLGGAVTGILNLRQETETDGAAEERYFTAGSKLLTASKAGAERFKIFGDRRICYKKGSVVYAGAEVLQLYAEETLLGTYAQWSDVVARIKSLNRKNTRYRVEMLDDFVVNGTLAMPARGKYAGLVIESAAEGQKVCLQATGNVTLTAGLELGSGVDLKAKAVSGASWKLTMAENTSLVTTGAFTVADLVLGEGALLQAGGKFTVKKTLEAERDAELILTAKKGAVVKDTKVGENVITVKVRDASGNRVTLAQGVTLLTVSGGSYATQYRLMDKDGQEQSLYRTGNAIKVQGTVSTPVTLYYMSGDEKISLGEYTNLADVRKEIVRRKDKQAAYRLEVREEIFVKGAVPLPNANTYRELVFAGERIRTTGNLTLTGNLTVYNEIRKVKSVSDGTALPYAVNISKYMLTIPEGSDMDNLGNVTGGTGSCLWIKPGVRFNMSGNLKVNTLTLDGILRGSGNVTVTDLISKDAQGAEDRAEFRLAVNKTLTIKGRVDTGSLENFIVNFVNKDDTLADIGAGTVIAVTQYGKVSQFRTENIMPVTLQEWPLIKNSTVIKTSSVFEGRGEWSGDYL